MPPPGAEHMNAKLFQRLDSRMAAEWGRLIDTETIGAQLLVLGRSNITQDLVAYCNLARLAPFFKTFHQVEPFCVAKGVIFIGVPAICDPLDVKLDRVSVMLKIGRKKDHTFSIFAPRPTTSCPSLPLPLWAEILASLPILESPVGYYLLLWHDVRLLKPLVLPLNGCVDSKSILHHTLRLCILDFVKLFCPPRDLQLIFCLGALARSLLGSTPSFLFLLCCLGRSLHSCIGTSALLGSIGATRRNRYPVWVTVRRIRYFPKDQGVYVVARRTSPLSAWVGLPGRSCAVWCWRCFADGRIHWGTVEVGDAVWWAAIPITDTDTEGRTDIGIGIGTGTEGREVWFFFDFERAFRAGLLGRVAPLPGTLGGIAFSEYPVGDSLCMCVCLG